MHVYTAAEVAANFSDFAGTYSDLFKSLHNFRPRGLMDPQIIADFLNSYEERFAEEEAREAAELEALGEQYGRVFRDWHEYYDMLERKDARERAEYFAEQAREEAEAREFARRGSPMPYIMAWEHGDRNASCARA